MGFTRSCSRGLSKVRRHERFFLFQLCQRKSVSGWSAEEEGLSKSNKDLLIDRHRRLKSACRQVGDFYKPEIQRYWSSPARMTRKNRSVWVATTKGVSAEPPMAIRISESSRPGLVGRLATSRSICRKCKDGRPALFTDYSLVVCEAPAYRQIKRATNGPARMTRKNRSVWVATTNGMSAELPMAIRISESSPPGLVDR